MKNQSHLKCLQQNSQGQSDLKQAEVRLENQAEQQKNLENRLHQHRLDSQQLAQSVHEKKQQLQQISSLVDSHKDRLEQYEEELKKLILEGEGKQKEIEALRRKIMEIKARQKVLLRMRDENEGFSSGSKKLLLESQNSESPLYQTLRPFYEFFNPEAEMAEGVAVVLRGYAQTLVVKKRKILRKSWLLPRSMSCKIIPFFASSICSNSKVHRSPLRNPYPSMWP